VQWSQWARTLAIASSVMVASCGDVSAPKDAPDTDGAAAAPAPAVVQEPRQTWQCGDQRLETRPADDGSALHLEGSFGLKTLQPEPAASGARYADGASTGDGKTVFWNKGEAALLTLDSNEATCEVVDGRSPWVVARESNALLRAVGQEPFWIIVVNREREGLVLSLIQPGEALLEWPVTRGSDGKLADDGGEISISSSAAPCRDAMTGALHAATFTLTLAGSTATGCGRDYLAENARTQAATP
jgi:membrane-bound inhibitor of C-type lysozyme